MRPVCEASVASFPGRSHLQYLIAYSMQIRRGKAWEIWSRAVRQVDRWQTHGGRCPTVVIPVLCQTVPGAMNDGWYWLCLANALASSPRTDSTRKGFEIPRQARPPCVYLLSTWHNRTWLNLPGLPPLYLHTVSDQILEVGTAWERGYSTCMLNSMNWLYRYIIFLLKISLAQ